MNHNEYGYWPSAITPQVLAGKSTRLGQMHLNDNQLYWLESRPQDNGRGVIVKYSEGHIEDITSADYSVRTRVHEYGSGDFWLKANKLIFCNDSDQCLYLQDLITNQVCQLTEPGDHKRALRYADGDISKDGLYTICVREKHKKSGSALDVENELVRVSLINKEVSVIAQGADFYSNPRISPDGKRLSWLSWEHPNMPWDNTELWLAELDEDGVLSNVRKISGGESHDGKGISVYNPQWSASNKLYYAADQNGWWHIYCADSVENSQPKKSLHEFIEIEFAFPQWQFSCNSFQVILNQQLNDEIIAIGIRNGQQALYKVNLETRKIEPLSEYWTAFNGEFVANNHFAYVMAATKIKGESIYQFGLETHIITKLKPSKSQQQSALELVGISKAEHISFKTTNDAIAHGYFYPPINNRVEEETNRLPPLILMSHGGPTGMANNGFNLSIQFWTSRGFAVADVNYRGSTGYGRAYRDSLKGQWGIYDVEDCIAMARHLADKGLVDGKRMAIRGGSAGGFTTLCALTFHNEFKVGMSRYGVADLESLAVDSHKFEIRYLDSVVGPLPQSLDVYKQRSPSEHTDQLSCPILILQGLDDKVVPPSQSEAMVRALEAKDLPYEYITFEGEGHGFRKPETIIRAFTAELEFYQKYLL